MTEQPPNGPAYGPPAGADAPAGAGPMDGTPYGPEPADAPYGIRNPDELELENTGPEDALEPELGGRLARDVAALIATVDQHSSELDSLNVVILCTAFAFGALAGIVFLQYRALVELQGAFPR